MRPPARREEARNGLDAALGAPEGVSAPMKTYAEKLLDPRWKEYRKTAIQFYGSKCSECPDDFTEPNAKIHVHHRRYLHGLDPWEYDMADILVLCEKCHTAIHDCEHKWRDQIRSMEPWTADEFSSLAAEIKDMGPHMLANFAARCRNVARQILHASIEPE